MKKHRSRSAGFTLIELLVVIVIIVALSGIILVATSGAKGKARDAQRVSDLSQLQLALVMYMDRCGQYPSSLSTSAACPTNAAVTLGVYISKIPTPPTGTYDYAILTNNLSSLIVNYVLHTTLESKGNAAIAKGLDASNIPSPSGYTWTPNGQPASYGCSSNTTTSTSYCIGPN